MATTTCDYCHKPLSLMRRLRGEQFCCVEHLDLYSAQQAEFALERLAASVTDKPNTERPPLPKPAPKLRPLATQVPQVDHAQASQTVSAVQEREAAPVAQTVEAQPPAPQADVPDYPVAPYLDQSEIVPRKPETVRDKAAAFEPVDTWGKASPAWRMPPFLAEPSDPRTWNAGKLVARIPPVAGWRELLVVKAPEPVEHLDRGIEAQPPSHGADVAGIEPAEVVQAGCTGLDIPDVFPARLSHDSRMVQPAAIAPWTGTEYLAVTPADEPAWTSMTEAVRTSLRLAANRLDRAAQLRVDLCPQAGSGNVEVGRGPELANWAPTQPAGLPLGASASVLPESGPRTPAPQQPQHSRMEFGGEPLSGPAAPQVVYALPAPAAWNWTPHFSQPEVAMPELLPREVPVRPATGSGRDWQEVSGTVHSPAMQWFAPHFGYRGPAFGWEAARPKSESPADSANSRAGVPAQFGAEVPRIREFRIPVTTGLEVSSATRLWPIPRSGTLRLDVGPFVSLRPSGTVPSPQLPHLVPLRPARFGCVSLMSPRLAPLAPGLEPAREVTRVTAELGPVKYRPVTMVVMPPPQFGLLPALLADEQRYVAQAPNGVWRLPRVRHTGYRALGPFPKLPVRMPDRYLHVCAPEMHEAVRGVPRRPAEVRQDLAGMPAFTPPEAMRIHPADYWVWPAPKRPKAARILPEQEPSEELETARIKRFGPGRAGLQHPNRSADGLAKGRGLR